MKIAQCFPANFEDNARAEASNGLKALAAAHLSQVGHDIHVDAGAAYQKILDAADKLGCDLIVMASHRPELADYLIGPNADKVVRHARMAVMVVRG